MSQYYHMSTQKDGDGKNTYYGHEAAQITEVEYATSIQSTLQSKDQKTKGWLRALRVVERSLNFIVSGLSLGIMINLLITFFRTRNNKSGSTTAWPTDPNLVPTIINTATALITTILNFIVIISYICTTGDPYAAANRTNNWATYWSMFTSVVGAIMFAISSGLLKALDSKRALWGYSCSAEAEAVQSFFSGLSFDLLCTTQMVSFFANWGGVVLYVLTAIDTGLVIRRWRSKKKLVSQPGGSVAYQASY